MDKRATIRDVAEAAGVSISTVHQALNNKKGVGPATRERIREVAASLGYQPNALASSLKRKAKNVTVLLPAEGGDNRFYYPPVWRGVRDYIQESTDLNLKFTELAYPDGRRPGSEELRCLWRQLEEGKLDGLLTVGHLEAFSPAEWRRLRDAGVAVSLTSSENPAAGSICCVQPDYDIIGRTIAELILSHIPPYGSIFLCCGNPGWLAHSAIVRGFDTYLAENQAPNQVYRNYSWTMERDNYDDILRQVSRPDVAACCSVLSQSSVLLDRALEESRKAERIFAVGSDLSDENILHLRQGTLDNIIEKSPYAQGYLAAKALAEYLTRGRRPEPHTIYVGSGVVFRSNLAMYEHRAFRTLFH